MREYTNLPDLLSRETNSRMPRAAAGMIKTEFTKAHPTATAFVLYKSGAAWTVIPAGPDESIKNIAQAARTRTLHGRAVAYCPREFVPSAPAVNPFATQES